ncbi:MAG: NAD(P)H-hydrate dehydratase [Bacteroidota bacterium]
MKIFSSAQIREWDQATISNEPVTSIDLMERAATKCAKWINNNIEENKQLIFFCGSGNNGGDGLAIARMLASGKRNIQVYVLKGTRLSADCEINLQRLQKTNVDINEIALTDTFPEIDEDDIVIDALFGTGLNKPLESTAQLLVQYINQCEARVISIDIPSGMFADVSSQGNTIIKATHTLSFQGHKLAFMFAENGEYTGSVSVLDIGLNKQYYEDTSTDIFTIDAALAISVFKPRKDFTHKYSFGHSLLYAGRKNMMGAAILCAESCLRSGAGLVTVHVKEEWMPIMQTALPEAICSAENNTEALWKKKAAIGIGPGLEITESNAALLKQLVTGWDGQFLIDASALSLLEPYVDLISKRKQPAVLTPHTGEFEKLFGESNNDFNRMELALQKAAHLNCYIILKGHHSLIACPDGDCFFNTTGNSGMATAGSGDVLTGIITGLLSQGYNTKQACLLGVYLHGLAGDFAAETFSKEAMIAGDIVKQLGAGFKTLYLK